MHEHIRILKILLQLANMLLAIGFQNTDGLLKAHQRICEICEEIN